MGCSQGVYAESLSALSHGTDNLMHDQRSPADILAALTSTGVYGEASPFDSNNDTGGEFT